MSFESGRKLGLTASIISIITPIAIVALYAVMLASIFSSISTAFTSGGQTPNFSPVLGAGISLIGFIIIGIISFVGLILFIVAMYQLSHYYNEPGIFKNIIYGLIVNIVGVAVIIVTVFIAVFATIGTVVSSTSGTPSIALFVVALIAIIGAGVAIALVSAWFYKRGFNKLAEKSGVGNFDTAGLLLLIGAIIPIVAWIGWIFAAIGFNSLKPTTTQPPSMVYAPSQSPASSFTQKKSCPYCGSENKSNAIYCQSCGRQLP